MAIDFQAARDPVCDGVEVLEAALAARPAAVADTISLWMFQVKEAGCKPALPGTPEMSPRDVQLRGPQRLTPKT